MSARMSSPDEEAWLMERRLMPLAELHALFCKKFNRPTTTRQTLVTIRKRIGASKKQGVDNKYPPGEFINNGGYWVVEGARKANGRRQQFMKHRIEWERINGPVPENHVLICLGEKTDCDPENWTPVPKCIAQYLRIGPSKIANIPQELMETAITIAKLKHRIGIRTDGRPADSQRVRLKNSAVSFNAPEAAR